VIFSSTGRFPVNLVQVIRQQHHTAHDALTWRALDDILNVAEKDFEIRKECGCVISFCKGQFRALGTEVDSLIVCYAPVARDRLCGGEIDGVGAGCETQVIRTST